MEVNFIRKRWCNDVEAEKERTRKEQILWYIGRIIDHLDEAQMRAVLVMLKRFYGQIGRRE